MEKFVQQNLPTIASLIMCVRMSGWMLVLQHFESILASESVFNNTESVL